MFSPSHLMEVAKSTGFVKNKSKLRPHMFLDFLLFRHPDDTRGSLSNFVCVLQSRFDKTFRRQSLHQRFTSEAVDFVKQLVKEQLSRQITTPIKALDYFQSIKIKDSTRFQIPEQLKDAYPGSGGGASEAGIHIQFEYELLSGEVTDFNITDAKRQDTTDAAETMDSVKGGDLIIRDLGYFVQKVFNHIIEAGAYFLTRVKPKTVLFDHQSGQSIDLKALHKWMKKKEIVRLEKLVTTNQINCPIRLIIEMLPDEVVEKRIGKARKEAKKKGRQLSDEYKSYAAFNLYITNVDKEKLSIDTAIKLYHIRWQIELRFKAWKSLCQLHKVKKMNKDRFECHLYAKLLFILIIWELGYNFQLICYQTTGKLVSLYKFHKMITDELSDLRLSFLEAGKHLKSYLTKCYRISRESLLQEKKKSRVNLEELLLLMIDNQ